MFLPDTLVAAREWFTVRGHDLEDAPVQGHDVVDLIVIQSDTPGAKRLGRVDVPAGLLLRGHSLNEQRGRVGEEDRLNHSRRRQAPHQEFAVAVNTGGEFDGSDSGARPDEAVSWETIALDGKSAKVSAEATIILPIIVSQTFAKFIRGIR
jgi:hypothetical protein